MTTWLWRRSLLSVGSMLGVAVVTTACGGGRDEQPGSTTNADTSGGTTGSTMSSTSGTEGSDGADDAPTTGLDDTTGSGDDSTGGEEPDETIIDCGTTLAQPQSGTCGVTSGSGAGLVLRGDVLGPDAVYAGGEVLLDAAGTIVCAACDCSGEATYADATQIVCPDAVVSPGLINSHDHISYANNAPLPPSNERYEHRHDWRLELDIDGGASNAQIQAAELRFVAAGATSAASAGGVRGLLRNLDLSSGLEGAPIAVVDSDTFPLDDASGEKLTSGCSYGDDPTTSTDIQGLKGYLPHISEGIDAAAYNEFQCTSTGDTDLIALQTAVVHAVGIGAAEAQILADEMAKVVWSPRSNISLYGNTAPVTLLDTMGVPIALGTDWVASGSMDVLRELKCADSFNATHLDRHFSDRQLWQMVTSNGALATGTESALGALKPGYLGDIAVFATHGRAPYRAVIEAEPADVVLVLRSGVPLYGDTPVLEAAFPGESCESFSLCSTDKSACLTREFGPSASFAALRSAIETEYPLFACGTPEDEPSCEPYRPEYSEGATATDADGDGLEDGVDNCPSVFNPIRPLDTTQADADGDGTGDNCDPCPLEAGDSCPAYDADDLDSDGVSNLVDNCPFVQNDQADADSDGHGDVCDSCSAANPGASACPLPIVALRDPNHPEHPEPGSAVAITDAYVTGIRSGQGSLGFYVQDASGAPFSGIFIYTGSQAPTVQVGNRVRVSGVYEEYFSLSEISNAVITVDDGGTTLPFEPLSFDEPATLATGSATAEQYESMLVRVGPVSIVNANPDAPSDFDEFSVTGELRIDDLVYDNAVDTGLNNTCPVGTSFGSITGILGFSFGNYKLMPRTPEDVQSDSCSPFSFTP